MTPLEVYLVAFVAAVVPVALGIMKVVNFVKARFPSVPADVWLLLAFALGVGYAFLTHTDLVHVPGATAPAGFEGVKGAWGYLLTGVGIGAVSAYWYEKNSALQSAPPTTPV